MKLYYEDGRPKLAGPLRIDTHLPGFSCIEFGAGAGYVVLEFLPNSDEEDDPDWLVDLTGEQIGGNRVCFLMVTVVEDLESPGPSYFQWVRSDCNWGVSGQYLWSRSRTEGGGFLIKVYFDSIIPSLCSC